MEKHRIKGKFLEKYFPEKNVDELEIEWPMKMAELSALGKAGKIVIAEKEFAFDEAKLCQWAYRGFSLQHQGAESMTEEDKAKAKEKRKTERESGKAISGMASEKQLEIIRAIEVQGGDCAALRSALKLPPK